jgi:hypothetical protein
MVVASALLALLAIAGCGLGPGAGVGSVELVVTRDFGSRSLLQRSVEDVAESDTVMRVLERNADISTRYGGGFVQSIEGIEGDELAGRSLDWFFYVDGVESPIGAADYSLHGRERVWWDYRDWTSASRVPAVVGSWPAPFVDGYEGRKHPVAVDCEGGADACAEVRSALKGAGAELAHGEGSGRAIRVLVGPWGRLRADPTAGLIEAGPQESGVFADFEQEGEKLSLFGLDQSGEAVREFGPGAGLVAATRRYEAPPVWVVTGVDDGGVRAAAGLLDEASLRNHYAVATEGGTEMSLPLR